MTLAKAIEAAREALDRGGFHATRVGHIEDALFISNALAALPDKPMTEDEIFELLIKSKNVDHVSGYAIRQVIRALKSANVLFVKEEA